MGKLTVAAISAALRARGTVNLADGDGLYLQIKGDRAYWICRYTSPVTGKRRETGLGPVSLQRNAPGVLLADARAAAADLQRQIRAGRDPLAEREAAAAEERKAQAEAVRNSVTFKTAALAYIEAFEPGWKSAVHAQQWRNTLETYAYPEIGDTPVGEVSTEDVLRVIKPIWATKTETASRLRGRIETVMAYAKTQKWRDGENVAAWRNHLALLLPPPRKVRRVRHHTALPFEDMPAFWQALARRRGVGAQALAFTILTAARTDEVISARRTEIDPRKAIWTVPPERMKGDREHRVPLTEAALAILALQPAPDRRAEGGGPVFGIRGAQLSNMTMLQIAQSCGFGEITVHGFRSTFRDWAAETTGHAGEVVEMALSHAIDSKAEEAYRRGDLLAKRRLLMEDWAAFVTGTPGAAADNVVQLRPTGRTA